MDIEALIIIISFAVVAALIYVWYLACREFGRIAAEKGHSDHRYFHFCFWLGLVGMLMVIALPDKGAVQPPHARSETPHASPLHSPMTPLSQTPPAKPLPARSPRRYTGTVPNPWRCSCGATNPASKGTCDSCGELKPR